MGLNAEHSWADAPVVGHLWEVHSHTTFLVYYSLWVSLSVRNYYFYSARTYSINKKLLFFFYVTRNSASK